MIHLIRQKLKKYFVDNGSLPNFEHSLKRLQLLGYSPAVVYDIGAYKGDFARLSLSIWPEANVFCFEPLSEKFAELKVWATVDKRVQAMNILAGNANSEAVSFNENETASSVLQEHLSKEFITSSKTMHTLDYCIDELNLPVPSLLKIDTQGYEYQVLQGVLKHLGSVEVVIAELNHIDLHKDVHLAEDVIQLLYLNGFVMYDVAEIHRRPFDSALWQTDFIFVKKDSALRSDKRWK